MSQKIPLSLRKSVAERAGFCCEYCRLPETPTYPICPSINAKYPRNPSRLCHICIDFSSRSRHEINNRTGILYPTTSSSTILRLSRVRRNSQAPFMASYISTLFLGKETGNAGSFSALLYKTRSAARWPAGHPCR